MTTPTPPTPPRRPDWVPVRGGGLREAPHDPDYPNPEPFTGWVNPASKYHVSKRVNLPPGRPEV